jgi:hypothetical protein
MLNEAYKQNIPCFCADLTLNPILVDWNKNIAARIDPLPGMNIGLLESNGFQNYLNWEEMKKFHPAYGAVYTDQKNGVYTLDNSFYNTSAGIFTTSVHYMKLAEQL